MKESIPLETEYSVNGVAGVYPDGTRLLRARTGGGRSVVIKVLASELASRAEVERRLLNEYEVGRRLHGEGALQPVAVGTWSGYSALVVEDFEGVSLEVLMGEPMPVAHFLRLAERIALALASMHAAGAAVLASNAAGPDTDASAISRLHA